MANAANGDTAPAKRTSLGREVIRLVDQELNAGKHAFQWQANGLPSGVYFYRLNGRNFQETRKLLLMK